VSLNEMSSFVRKKRFAWRPGCSENVEAPNHAVRAKSAVAIVTHASLAKLTALDSERCLLSLMAAELVMSFREPPAIMMSAEILDKILEFYCSKICREGKCTTQSKVSAASFVYAPRYEATLQAKLMHIQGNACFYVAPKNESPESLVYQSV
jgi:hypothetical protein